MSELFCIACIDELVDNTERWARPAVTVYNGKAYCLAHAYRAIGHIDKSDAERDAVVAREAEEDA